MGLTYSLPNLSKLVVLLVIPQVVELIHGFDKPLRTKDKEKRKRLGHRNNFGNFEVEFQFQAAALTNQLVKGSNLIFVHVQDMRRFKS